MKIQKQLLVLLFLLFAFCSHAQLVKMDITPSMGLDSLKMRTFLDDVSKEDKELALYSDLAIVKANYRKALRGYKKLKKKYPCAYTFKRYGDLKMLKKQYKSSIVYFDKAIEMDSLYYFAYASKLNACMMLGEKSELDVLYTKMGELFVDNNVFQALLIIKYITENKPVLAAKKIIQIERLNNNKFDNKNSSFSDFEWMDILLSVKDEELENDIDLVNFIIAKEMKIQIDYSIDVKEKVQQHINSAFYGKLYISSLASLSEMNYSAPVIERLEKNGFLSVWQCWRMALLKLNNGESDSAEDYYAKAITLNDSISKLCYEASCLNRNLRNTDSALDNINKAIRLDSLNADYLSHRAYVNLDLKNTSQACKDAESALIIDGDNVWANEFMMYHYLRKKNYTKALLYSDNILRIDPFFKDIYFIRAKAFFRNKEYQKSKDECFIAFKQNSKNSGILDLLVNVSLLTKSYGDTKNLYESLIVKNPSDISVRMQYLVFLFDIKDYFSALESAEGILELDSKNKMAISHVSRIANLAKDDKVRKKAWEIKNNPKYNPALIYLQQAKGLRSKDDARALICYDKALKYGANISDVAFGRFSCCESLASSHVEYKKMIDVFVKRYPNCSELKLVEASYYCSRMQDYDGLKIYRDNLSKCNVMNFFFMNNVSRYLNIETSLIYAEEVFDFLRKSPGFASHKIDLYREMARFYVSARKAKKAITLLDEIKRMNLVGDKHKLNVQDQLSMNRCYLASYEISKDWDKWLSLKKKMDGLEGEKVLPKDLLMLLASKEQYIIVKELIQDKDQMAYCWLDVMVLIKKYKYDDAKKLLISSLNKCKWDKEISTSVYLDLLDLSTSVKSKRRRWYIKKILKDVFKK